MKAPLDSSDGQEDSSITKTTTALKPSLKPTSPGVELPALLEGHVLESKPQQPEAHTTFDLTETNTDTNAAIGRVKSPRRGCQLPRWLRRGSNRVYRRVAGVSAYAVFFLVAYVLLWIFTGESALPPRCYAYTPSTAPSSTNGTEPPTQPPPVALENGKAAVCYGGTTLDLVIFYATAFACGQLVELIRLPGLLGMLLSGLVFRCVSVFATDYVIFMGAPPPSDAYRPLQPIVQPNGTSLEEAGLLLNDPLLVFAATLRVNKALSGALRQIALATILTRAGLGLEPAVLRRIWTSMIRLTCMPCLTEAVVGMVVCKYLMSWPWAWAAMMGFTLAAVSPAVVVPSMLRLEVAGLGVAQGIPTLIMGASSLDDVLAITGFGIAQAIAFAKGDVAMVALSGPLEVLAGACLGVLLAVVLFLLPPPAMAHSNTIRGLLLYSISIASITGTIKMGLPGAGALCCLICSMTCAFGWQRGMPWRFKHPETTPLEAGDDEETTNDHNSHRQAGQKAVAVGATEYHEYYRQHLRLLRRLVSRSGGVGQRPALAAVSESRRFSLSEPKPHYEDDESFDGVIVGGTDTSLLGRSLSVPQPLIGRGQAALGQGRGYPRSQATEDVNSSAVPPNRLALDKAKGLECLKVMRSFMATCWWFMQPLLFCLIGADIPVEKLQAGVISRGLAALLIALTFRVMASVLAVTPSTLRFKERIFVAVAWLPKATVQAAIGPLALDSARVTGDPLLINWGEQIITLSALSILLTAPLAALLIPLVAPYLLQQDSLTATASNTSSVDYRPGEGTELPDVHNKVGEQEEENVDTASVTL